MNVLHLTGHTLISDILRDDDITSGVKTDAKIADVFKKFPTLSRILTSYEQHQLITYIEQKVRVCMRWRQSVQCVEVGCMGDSDNLHILLKKLL